MSGIAVLTWVHVAISLIAIVAGLVALVGLMRGEIDRLTGLFLATTVATSVTGFFFPFNGITPAFGFGVVSMILLGLSLFALYGRRLAGRWRKTYVITAVIALYLNVFVLIVQAFLKVPSLNALAPNGNEPPFAITQGVVLVLFLIAGFKAVRRLRPVSFAGSALA